MFGWGKAECPVAAQFRPWFDARARWLVESLGRDRTRNAVVMLPTQEYLPGAFDASDASIARLYEIVCRHMGVDPAVLRLELIEAPSNHEMMRKLGLWDIGGTEHFAAGLYDEQGHPRVRFDLGQDKGLISRVATLAHEVAHYVLLGEKRLTGKEKDHEQVTEMTTVFLGMGLFNANGFLWQKPDGAFGRLGYFDASHWAYTLALFAWFRGETKPAWAEHLRSDVRTPFERGLRFLAASGVAPGELPAASGGDLRAASAAADG